MVMLYGSETWVLTLYMGRVLCRFHQRVALRLTERQPQRGSNRGWVYPLLEDALEEAGLQEVETYISRHQNTVAQFIVTSPIMELCMDT